MALSDQDGNELSSIRNGADITKTVPAINAPGQAGGPPVAKGVWVGDHQAHKQVTASNRPLPSNLDTALKMQPASVLPNAKTYNLPPGLKVGFDAEPRKFEISILQFEDDKGLEGLEGFLNQKGEEGWEPFQIIPAANRGGKLVHYVHLKREKL